MITGVRARAAFLDRDGVINVDHGYVGQVERFELALGAPDGMRRLIDAGFLLIVVTNQSGIGRGYYDATDFATVTRHMERLLAASGVTIAHVAFCPHLPDDGCYCRKPQPGMILDSAVSLGVDLRASVMIGDSLSDISAGRAAGVGRCYLVGDAEQPLESAGRPDGVFPTLLACANAIIRADDA